MAAWRRLTFSVAESALEDLLTGLHEAGTLGAEVRGDRLDVFFPDTVDEAALLDSLRQLMADPGARLKLESSDAVADGFWHERWMESLVPFEIGESFLVVPGPATPASTGGRRVIRLTPGRAFGTGEHATTRMCLNILEREVTAGCSLLDVGTGSGILAIGARLMGAGQIVAIDTDPEAIATASRNALINDSGDLMLVAGGLEAIRCGLRFDFVVANITGADIVRLMKRLCVFATRRLILSGILCEEETEVVAAARSNGFDVTAREGGEWLALSMNRVLA